MAAKKKSKRAVYRLVNKETGEHYTVRLTSETFKELSEKTVKKFSRKLRKHVDFKASKFKSK